MSGILWSKWYFPDWTNDPGVRASSLAARGLWMDMLCIAARHDPPGYVAINGNNITSDTLARMVGASVPDVESLLAELERNGVFSRNRNGTIYSRRMVREAKASKTARENGKKGGNPSLGKQTQNSASVNPPLNYPLNTHKPEANKPEKKEEELELRSCAVAEAPRTERQASRFQEFWQVYPRRAGSNPKASAEKKFDAFVKSGVDPSLIIAGARAYAEQQSSLGKVGTEYIKMAEGWLNKRCWQDDYSIHARAGPALQQRRVTPHDQIQNLIDQMTGDDPDDFRGATIDETAVERHDDFDRQAVPVLPRLRP